MVLIAVPLSDKDFKKKIRKAKELGADIIEYRVDAFQNLDLSHIREVITYGNSLGLKAILTIRKPEEGGFKEIKDRLFYYENLIDLVDFVDVELKSKEEEIKKVKELTEKFKKKLIISYHNFSKTPEKEEIEKIFNEIKSNGANIAKVALMANNKEDVSRLLCVVSSQEIPTIAISMGELGKISRIAGSFFNSIITFCSLEDSFAPGQMSITELKKLLETLNLKKD